MKKLLLSILTMVTLGASAVPPPNYVNIPDANFKAYLVGNIAINTNNDAEIETSEAAAFTGSIVCANLSITDLTGIEAFTSATLLWCFGNSLTNLNVSQNTALTILRCNNNSLTSLDVSQNTALTNLSCYNNSITALNVTQNTLLTYLVCNSNSITNLDVTHNTALTTLFCNNNSLTNLNITQNTALVNLNCSNTTLTNLDITNNTALTTLRCYSNLLTNLDVTQNDSLITLLCYTNLITSLDVSQNIALEDLNCFHNSLTNLVVTQNTALLALSCSSNLLTNLNVANGNNTALTSFNATNNPNLTCIQVDDVTYSTTNWTVANNSIDTVASFSTNCPSCTVNIPDANFKAYLLGNSSINTNGDTEIQCSEAIATDTIDCNSLSISDLTGIEAFTALTFLNCQTNQLSNINVSNNTLLEHLYIDHNNITNIDVSTNTTLQYFGSEYNSLTSLNLSTNIALIEIYCGINAITNLDFSNNSNLKKVFCSNTNLQTINLTNNLLLEGLFIDRNYNLTTLDLSTNTALIDVNCFSTGVLSLDLSNSTSLNRLYFTDNQSATSLNLANTNTSGIASFFATNCPNLFCIQVDDTAWSNANWTVANGKIDATASFSTNCSSVVLVSSIVTTGQGGVTDITTSGGTLQMEATVFPSNASNATYNWSIANGTGTATISATGLVTAQTNGIVTVTATANDGSGITGGTSIMLSNQTTGILEINSFKTTVYPNPTTGLITITANNVIDFIEVYDITGKKIARFLNTNTINLNYLNEGLYIVKMYSKNEVSIQQIIKK